MSKVDVNIEGMRRPHENPTEWRVRKAFLEKNAGKLDVDRLECLSQCFVNCELYGCGYPDKVMNEIKDLGSDIIDNIYPNRSR
ncbi:unnamed protein product [Dibothriocephalus latus]|uniref:XRN2-binding (XTBD) domain-containing protein n=1 Tax=Dibothriocephalus latus TaxID=60516 RepID=A0A3P6S1Z6_DIBLA|nr:unnamed protein product [Dibothriocephalus latus]